MKVLFIGHYREKSGWGQATRDYLLALDSVGVDVVARPILLGLAQPSEGRVRELETKSTAGCTHCVQAVLPHYMEYDGNFEKCVGIYIPDTYNLEMSPWIDKINCMDDIWVSANDAKNHEFFNSKAHLVPVPCNLDELRPKGLMDVPVLDGNFTFYFIGEYNRRKHLAALVRAFHSEFDRTEPVRLLIKTGKPGVPPQALAEEVQGMCDKIKINLRKYPKIEQYTPEALITNHLSFDELMALHMTCDCFVMPSFGEGWCIPAFHAMYFGNTPVVSEVGGMKEYITATTGFPVRGRFEPVFGHDDAMPGLGSCNEIWFNIDTLHLQDQMRRAYERKSERRKQMQATGRQRAQNYTYNAVGNLMKELLNDECNGLDNAVSHEEVGAEA